MQILFCFFVVVLVSCKSENPAAERLNLSFDSVSLDSGGGRRDAAQEDDTDFYSGNSVAVFAAAGSSLQNGVAAAAVTSSSYSEALTPVTNKVIFIELNGHHLPLFYIAAGPRLDWNHVLKTTIQE